jgi:hypothetical protein
VGPRQAGRQHDWDAPAEERAEAARGSCLGILLTAALLAALFAVTLAGAGMAH